MTLLTLLLGFIILIGLFAFILLVAKLIESMDDEWTKNYEATTPDDYNINSIFTGMENRPFMLNNSIHDPIYNPGINAAHIYFKSRTH